MAQRLVFIGGIVLSLVGKLAFTHSHFREPLLAKPFWLAVTFLTLCAFLLSTLNFNSRLGKVLAVSLNAALSVVLWGDLVYYRLFGDWPSISSLVAAHQLKTSSHSLWQATQYGDLWLFADFPLLLLALSLFAHRPRPAGRSMRLIPLAILLSLPWVAASFLAFSIARPESVPLRHDNVELVSYHGILLYHAYDLLCYCSGYFRPLAAPPVKEVLPAFRKARSSVGPSVPHFGACEGANVVFVQLESMESFPLGLWVEGQEVTPVLNTLVQSSLWTQAYDQTLQGSSSDGEFIYLNGLHPPSFGPLVYHFPEIRYLALLRLLARQGYLTQSVMPYSPRFWNRGLMDAAYGFSSSLYEEAFSHPEGSKLDWGLKDAPLFQQYLSQLPSSDQPFFSYLVTLMMHHPFPELPPDEQRLALGPDLKGTDLGKYLQLAAARDAAIGELVEGLKQKKMWDSTILVLSSQHTLMSIGPVSHSRKW